MASQQPSLREQEQLELIGLPDRPELVMMCQAEPSRYLHTGERALRDVQIVEQVAELLVAGRGMKAIARRVGASPHTIRAMRDALEVAGRLAPFKDRLMRKLQRAAEDSVAEYHEGLISGEVSAAQAPVPAAIFIDKLQLLAGEPTVIIERRDDLLPDRLAEALDQMFDRMPAAAPIAVESVPGGSAGSKREADQIEDPAAAVLEVEPEGPVPDLVARGQKRELATTEETTDRPGKPGTVAAQEVPDHAS